MRPERHAPIMLERDCEATLIPGGQPVTLSEGDEVIVTQSLGGSFTVQTSDGYLARISNEDADALGLDPTGDTEADKGPAETGPFDIAQVIEQLKTVFDPEIPINVVDLGLIYACDAHTLADGSHRVEIKMSMTAPGCGMGDVLKDDARSRVQTVLGVSEVDVELVWDPPWDQSRLTDAARLELGLF
jgi:probable FeS assembly SUF system protein SufT